MQGLQIGWPRVILLALAANVLHCQQWARGLCFPPPCRMEGGLLPFILHWVGGFQKDLHRVWYVLPEVWGNSPMTWWMTHTWKKKRKEIWRPELPGSACLAAEQRVKVGQHSQGFFYFLFLEGGRGRGMDVVPMGQIGFCGRELPTGGFQKFPTQQHHLEG